MNPIITDLPVQLREDEYLDEESKLIYCSRCHTPRQKRLQMTGKLFEPRCMCACQMAAYEQREQERKHREFLDAVAKNRRVGLTDPVLRKHTFENDLGYNPRQMNMAKRFVENWDQFRKSSMGLLLWGNVGTGKSFIAGCIANALLDKGVPVMMTNFARLLNKLTDMYSGDRNTYINLFNSFPLLIIDDLGVERNSEFAREQVFNIIDSRYRSQLPLIVTTNLTVDELKNPTDLARARIYDRVLERCTAIKVNDQNIRKLNMAENLARAKQLLEEVAV
ncbi:MAG TPA: ATP-binding protein [Candidatus Faecousia excrementipullorum]|nr:ATP-binding protein [Candidatus Faecousia excrementipullorum]